MKKIISSIIIGFLVCCSLGVQAEFFEEMSDGRGSDRGTSLKLSPYSSSNPLILEKEIMRSKTLNDEYPFSTIISKEDDVELLWDISIGAGEDEEYPYTVLDHIGSILINNDTVPDILAGLYAIDGMTGEIIYQFERGVFYGLGDVNNDGREEIITGNDRDMKADIYCLNTSDGSIIWKNENIDSIYIDSVSIGDVTGDSTNEVIVGMDDLYCFNGINGNIIWTKHLIDGWLCSIAISDVNNDGENEIIAGTYNNDPRVCCLDGKNGDTIWEYKRKWVGGACFRTLCIDNFNDDPYMEIIVEGNPTTRYAGIMCLSGYNGKILWTWDEEPARGSFQSILSADLISSIPGNEVIAGGVGGIYCLYGGNVPPASGRVIWHAGGSKDNNIVLSIIMSASLGDIDGDGALDVVGSTCGAISSAGTGIYALDGQYGSLLWFKGGVKSDSQNSIMCVDLNDDLMDEVVSINSYYVEKFLFNVTALQSDFPTNNYHPDAPILNGPPKGNSEKTYEYSAISFDPDNDGLYYYFDWGDGTGDISAMGKFGESKVVTHSWKEEKSYIIKVKAIDEHGADSNWTTMEVTMPISKAIIRPFLNFLNQHPNLFPVLRMLLHLIKI